MEETIDQKSKMHATRRWLVQNYFSIPKDPRTIIFLDRDDTVIKDLGSNTHKNLPRIHQKLIRELSNLARKLNKKIIFVIITNQSRIFKKETNILSLKFFHFLLVIYLRFYGVKIQRIVTCPHSSEANCKCRKPNPTTIFDTLLDFQCESLPRFMIGNSLSDINAGLNAGCFTIGISENLIQPSKFESNKFFLGYFTLKSSFAQVILKKLDIVDLNL